MLNSKLKFWMLIGFLCLLILGAAYVWNSTLRNKEVLFLTNSLNSNGKIANIESSGAVTIKCILDLSNISYGKIQITDDVYLKAWTGCSTFDLKGKIISFNVPLFIEGKNFFYPTIASGVTNKNGNFYEFDPLAVRAVLKKLVDIDSPNNLSPSVRLVAGADSNNLLLTDNPFSEIYTKTGLDRDLIAFAKELDISLLPKVSEIDKMLLAYRVSLRYK